MVQPVCVNALSGLYLISTCGCGTYCKTKQEACVNALSGLYLISTSEIGSVERQLSQCVNALSGLYLISTEEVKAVDPEREKDVSMPSRAYTSFLRYHFKNLGFMRFPEPVFAGIYQNILTTAVFRAC